MTKKDFYIGVLIIAIGLHMLGFITSPQNFGDFNTYLSQSPIISLTFLIEVVALLIFIFSGLIKMVIEDLKEN